MLGWKGLGLRTRDGIARTPALLSHAVPGAAEKPALGQRCVHQRDKQIKGFLG